MARLKSLLKVEGTIDDLSFYQSKNGHLVRKKGGVKSSQILNDPKYVRTRENMQEFGQLAQAGKIFRDALRTFSFGSTDSRLPGRLSKRLNVIKLYDLVNQRGQRTIAQALHSDEAVKQFLGFTLNERAILSQIFRGIYSLDLDNSKMSFQAMQTEIAISAPQGATQAGFQFMWTQIDFETGISVNGLSNEHIISLDKSKSAPAFELTAPAITEGKGVLLIVFKLNFYQTVNGQLYPLNSGASNPVEIISAV